MRLCASDTEPFILTIPVLPIVYTLLNLLHFHRTSSSIHSITESAYLTLGIWPKVVDENTDDLFQPVDISRRVSSIQASCQHAPEAERDKNSIWMPKIS
ncbi:hypothetical protein AVEN_150891-1 [Araneus ventricosus]|uniref:Uncharacterized protein n=1 Tax=Araneus ventricosus TaxID=182803 RepID=A0A4Y2C984_ARAVE|nr:hypothetical protein AVEN_150891-1 [Araneus ventricosus]